MSYADNPYRSPEFTIAGLAPANERADFIRKTYSHLIAAIFLFVGLEALLLSLPGIDRLAFMAVQGYGWLIVLGAFMAVSWLAEHWARSAASPATQYAGLTLYVVAEAVIFVPLLYFASTFSPDIIPTAGIATLVVFGGLTAIVLLSGHDFSYLRTALYLGGFIALGLIVASILVGFSLGVLFTTAMIALASGYILYHTSNVLHHYRLDQHVAASLALFASVALLFWYIVQLVMRFTSRD
ncbi:MAG: Bax inhibitor-1 family protein [Pirellulales bacterium]